MVIKCSSCSNRAHLCIWFYFLLHCLELCFFLLSNWKPFLTLKIEAFFFTYARIECTKSTMFNVHGTKHERWKKTSNKQIDTVYSGNFSHSNLLIYPYDFETFQLKSSRNVIFYAVKKLQPNFNLMRIIFMQIYFETLKPSLNVWQI